MRFALAFIAGCAQVPGPHLTSATPPAAQRGATVTIAGERMCDYDCANAAGNFVFIGEGDSPDLRLSVAMFGDTSAQVMIPDIAFVGETHIVLTVDASASNALPFEVLP